jgi:hypothetical protein
METTSLAEQVKQAKADLKALCPFKKGDLLQYQNKEGKTVRGRFNYVFINDKLEAHIKIDLPKTSYIGWTGSYDYITNPDYSLFEVVENPTNIEQLWELDRLDQKVEREIEQVTRLLRHQQKRLKKIRKAYEDRCIHEWQDMGATGEQQKPTFGDPMDVHRYACPHCGKEIESI